MRVPTDEPAAVTARLTEAGLLLSPIGDVVQLKACDFCDGEKGESIPLAEELNRRLGGLKVPKELKIGFNGCAMACYGAVTEEIGIVYRRGTYDLFLGGKKSDATPIRPSGSQKEFRPGRCWRRWNRWYGNMRNRAIPMNGLTNFSNE